MAGVEDAPAADGEEEGDPSVPEVPPVSYAAFYQAMQIARSYVEQHDLPLEPWRQLMAKADQNRKMSQSDLTQYFSPDKNKAPASAPHFPSSIPRVALPASGIVVGAGGRAVNEEDEDVIEVPDLVDEKDDDGDDVEDLCDEGADNEQAGDEEEFKDSGVESDEARRKNKEEWEQALLDSSSSSSTSSSSSPHHHLSSSSSPISISSSSLSSSSSSSSSCFCSNSGSASSSLSSASASCFCFCFCFCFFNFPFCRWAEEAFTSSSYPIIGKKENERETQKEQERSRRNGCQWSLSASFFPNSFGISCFILFITFFVFFFYCSWHQKEAKGRRRKRSK